MTTSFLSYPRKIEHWGYPYGVMAYYQDNNKWLADLHGPFLTHEEADAKIDALIVHKAIYESYTVVKIETPQAPTNRDPRDN